MPKKLLLIFAFILSAALAGLAYVNFVQSAPAGACGDGIVQAPNASGYYEKCDDGAMAGGAPAPKETERCTAQCGQKMLGWGWSGTAPGNFGWLSLNCTQFFNVYPCAYPFSADITAGDGTAQNKGEVKGWAWADNVGWICFGSTCAEPAAVTACGNIIAPPAGILNAVMADNPQNPTSPQITGWAKICALKDLGWISLNCSNNPNECQTSDYKVLLLESKFGAENRFTLKGFAWNNNNNGVGLGWVSFNPEFSALTPWLQTQLGDIYAQKGITGEAPPVAVYNATYRILSGGNIANFYSLKFTPEQGYATPLGFPTPATGYANALGSLDIDSLLCPCLLAVPPTCNSCVNKYGKTVNNIATKGLLSSLKLLDQVYYNQGALTIPAGSAQVSKFLNGASYENGAGTLVIDGNLTLNADITYDELTSPTAVFKNLASAAWIVRGDLKVSCNVKNLAGNFIVVGNGTACNPDTPGPTGCGQIISSYDSASCENRLRVSGLMMARKFNFSRVFSPTEPNPYVEGTEVVTYDGRLLANTPPGLSDFSKALPNWSGGPAGQ